MIKYIIFDLAGVVVQSGTKVAYQKISSLLSISADQVRAYLGEATECGGAYRKGEITKEEFWQKALAGWGKTYDWKVLNDMWVSAYTPNNDTFAIVVKLHQNNYQLGVLSNTVEDRFHFINQQINLSKYFSAMVISYQDHVLKPDKKAFELIMERLNIKDPKEAVYIDDKEIHANVAKSLGMNAIVCKDAKRLEKDLRNLGVQIERKKFDLESFKKTLRRNAGVFTAKNHPEWRTKRDVVKWVEKGRKEADRTF